MACSETLERVFAGILVATAAGCGPAVDADPDEERSGADVCDGQAWWALETIEPTRPFDYLELRALTDGGPETVEDVGQPCATATDVEACTSALDGLSGQSSLFVEYGQASLALTHGDTVEVISTFDGLRAFLGEIDSPADAALLLRLSGSNVACGPGPDVEVTGEGYVMRVENHDCAGEPVVDTYLVRPGGEIEVVESSGQSCGTGRLPDGLCGRRRSRARGPVGRFLAEVAELEAASVPAFEQLGRELGAHGAPMRFRAGARSARADEVRHARMTRRLAERYGARVHVPRVRDVPLKDMVSMAADNAAEGCVRETFGALVAHAQSQRAQDPAVKRAMRTIARDESRHAALSWEIATWARQRMTPSERRRVASSAKQSVERLREELTAAVDPAVEAALGMPGPDVARAMFGGLHASVLHSLERA